MIRPLGDNVVIRMDPDEETVGDAGILLKPENADGHPLATGEVIAKGPGKWTKKNVREPIPVEVGDGVVFVRYHKEVHTNKQFRGMEGNDQLVILKPKDIMLAYDRANAPRIDQ
jgi:co-chaperonin GroES (HSP10)